MTAALLVLLALAQPAELARRLDADRVVDFARRLSEEVAQEPSGAGFASATSGSPEEAAIAAAVASELAKLGLEVRRESFPVRRFEYGEVALTANGETVPAITLHSGGGTWGRWDAVPYRRGNVGEGRAVEAKLVDAGRGLAPDYERLGSVAGKVVLVEWTSWPGFVILEAAARGAAAILLYDYPGRSFDEALKQNTVIYHDAVPSVDISIESAEALKRALAAGPVAVRLENRVDASYGFSENVIGILRGREAPDEWLAVSAHHDRWFRGAQDDAVGLGVLVELARLVAGAPERPRRSHLFVSFGSEESGGADAEFDWLAGSYAFVRAHPEIVSRLVYGFNVDGAGWPGERAYLYGSLEMRPFHEKILDELGWRDRVALRPGVTDWVDAWTLAAVGGASAAYLLSFEAHGVDGGPDAFSPYYHTQLDRVGARPYENLDRDLLFGALALARLDEAEALPVALSELGRFALEGLERDRERLFEAANGLPPRFSEAEDRARSFVETALDRERSPGEAPALWNGRLLRARKELAPWLLSVSSSRAVLKTTPCVDDAVAFERALAAARAEDPAAAAEAIEEVSSMSWGVDLSSEAYRAERLMSFAASDWSREYRQNPEMAAPDVYALHAALERGELDEETLQRIQDMEKAALERLRGTLFLIAGKLEKAEAILRGEPVLGAPPVGRVP